MIDYAKGCTVNTTKNYESKYKMTEYGVAVLNRKDRYVLPKKGYISLARAVYQDKMGSIPKNYEIHHIDGDRKNNDIDNLIAISHEDHVKMHKQVATRATKTIRKINEMI